MDHKYQIIDTSTFFYVQFLVKLAIRKISYVCSIFRSRCAKIGHRHIWGWIFEIHFFIILMRSWHQIHHRVNSTGIELQLYDSDCRFLIENSHRRIVFVVIIGHFWEYLYLSRISLATHSRFFVCLGFYTLYIVSSSDNYYFFITVLLLLLYYIYTLVAFEPEEQIWVHKNLYGNTSLSMPHLSLFILSSYLLYTLLISLSSHPLSVLLPYFFLLLVFGCYGSQEFSFLFWNNLKIPILESDR